MRLDKKFGMGIVGCGTIAYVHAEAIQRINGADLISVYSRNRDHAERLGRKFDVMAHDNWEDFIQDDRLEIVTVCTPSGTHLDYGRLIAEEGKHVVVEKPIEVTLDRGKQLIDVCKRHGIKLAVVFQNRFIPDVIRMKKTIDDGELGKIFLGDATIKWFRTQDYYDRVGWRGTFALDGGGVLINQAIHTIDLLQWMLGKVESIYGQIGTFTHDRIEGEDAAVVCLRFQSGAMGIIEASTSVQPAMDRRLEVHGERGSAILNGNSLRVLGNGFSQPNIVNSNDSGKSGASSPLQNFSVEPHQNQFEAIIDAIRIDNSPPVSGEESLESLAIVLAIYESARRCLPVKFI